MNIDQIAFGQVATTLAKHFDSMYYVDIESDNFIEFFHSEMLEELKLSEQGTDFFAFLREQAKRVVHPDDLDYVLQLIDKEAILKKLLVNNSSIVVCRFILNGQVVHICHINIICDDHKHILGCIKNIELEFQEREEQEKLLKSVERLARLDELTGIKNKNAYAECVKEIDDKIIKGDVEYRFAVVMCDINDLKLINDTRGHSFGDESIQRVCRMLGEIYENSEIYRIGGDEFVVILTGEDYKNRKYLLDRLKNESEENMRTRSGPVVACGMSSFDYGIDKDFNEVFERADGYMYDNKKELKSGIAAGSVKKTSGKLKAIPIERKRKLDSLFGALYTVAGEGYIFLTDLKYNFSRWSLPLINDFGLQSEYMYQVEKVWEKCIHPDDVGRYLEVIDAVLNGESVLYSISYRARKADGTYVILKPRCFVLNDQDGNPEYFGGIIIPQ